MGQLSQHLVSKMKMQGPELLRRHLGWSDPEQHTYRRMRTTARTYLEALRLSAIQQGPISNTKEGKKTLAKSTVLILIPSVVE
jgi:hypothetical protein